VSAWQQIGTGGVDALSECSCCWWWWAGAGECWLGSWPGTQRDSRATNPRC